MDCQSQYQLGQSRLVTPITLINIKKKCEAVDDIPGLARMNEVASSVMLTCVDVSFGPFFL